RGWCQYYRCTSSPAVIFSKLSAEIFWDMAHWLGRKYELSMPAIMRRFKKEKSFGTKRQTLALPNEYKTKKLLGKTWHNPYTAKEEIVREKILVYESLWNGTEDDRVGWGDTREEVMAQKGTTCYVCGTVLHPSEVEIDHFSTPRARFKDKTEA